MIFSQSDYKNWDQKAHELFDQDKYYEANHLLLKVYNDMVFRKRQLKDEEIYSLYLGLGCTFYEMNCYKQALYFLDSIYNTSSEFDKSTNTDIGVAIAVKAIIVRIQGKKKEAFKLLDDYTENYNDSFYIRSYASNFVEFAFAAGEYKKGVAIGLKSLNYLKRTDSYESSETTSVLLYLGLCYFGLRKYSLASICEEERLRLIEELGLKDDIVWALSVNLCTKYRYYRGQYKKAKEFNDMLEGYRVNDDAEDKDKHTMTRDFLYWKACIAMKLGNLKTAENFFKACERKINQEPSMDRKLMNELKRKKENLIRLQGNSSPASSL